LILTENGGKMKEIDEVARRWEKTKDPKYKKLWYELITKKFNYESSNNSATKRKPNTTGDRKGS